MPTLIIVGWNEGLKKVSMTKLLQERLGLSFSAAKRITDNVLDGKRVFLNVDELNETKALADDLFDLGAIVKLE